MTIGKLAVLAVALAFASGGIGAALADWRSTDAGEPVVLAGESDGRRDDGGPEAAAVEEQDPGDGDRTRGDDGTNGGNNTGDGDRTRGNDGTAGGNNTGDGDWTAGNDGTAGGDNTQAAGGGGLGGGGGGDASAGSASGGGDT